MKKKPTILFLILIIFLGSVYASYWIYTNTITITVSEYALTWNVDETNPVKYQNITFTVDLSLDANPVEGATIYLFKDESQFASNITDVNGECTFEINMTEAGTFDFKAGYEVVP